MQIDRDEWPLRRLTTEVVGSSHKSADDAETLADRLSTARDAIADGSASDRLGAVREV